MTDGTKTCPFCGEEILITAKKCKHCGEWLESKPTPRVEQKPARQSNKAVKYKVIGIAIVVLIGLCCLKGIMYLVDVYNASGECLHVAEGYNSNSDNYEQTQARLKSCINEQLKSKKQKNTNKNKPSYNEPQGVNDDNPNYGEPQAVNESKDDNSISQDLVENRPEQQSEKSPFEKPAPTLDNKSKDVSSYQEPDFTPFMNELQRRIKMNWDPPQGNESERVVVLIKIAKDGALLACKVLKSSGVQAVDDAAIDAVRLTAPFRPLPSEYKGESVEIQFTFDYNVH